ncbi:MAG TPA: MarR family transcriptional regulator [Burkholderiales bacterium]|nr:MarR family transcriptional regulator [Burkholderiales bacterium]
MAAVYDPKNYDVQQSIPYLMGRVRMSLHDTLDKELAQFDLTAAQYLVLLFLANGMASTASNICDILRQDPGAMTRMLDRLESKGFVRRTPDPDDRRTARLELTPEGKAAYPKILAAGVGVLNRILRGFSKGEIRQMEDFLKRMLANV